MSSETSPPQINITARFGEDDLKEFWQQLFQVHPPQMEAHPLAGDASTRQYFRIKPKGSDPETTPASLILMQLEKPAEGDDIDFTRMLRFLEGLNLPVPKLYTYDRDRGFLLLEDCGDETLESRLSGADPKAVRHWYQQSIELLVEMQSRGTQNLEPDNPAFHLRFNTKKLMWEMDFMLEHYVEGLLGHAWQSGQREAVREELVRVCEELDRQPVCFTHRDYHCRNLMVKDDKLVLLDFQDARWGPAQYDLVSLLRDSYYQIPEDLVWEMVDRFIDLKNQNSEETIDHEEFLRIFDLMSIQRNLKAVGTFAFQTFKMKNERYRPYIEPTLKYIRDTLIRRPECRNLQQQLENVVPLLKP